MKVVSGRARVLAKNRQYDAPVRQTSKQSTASATGQPEPPSSSVGLLGFFMEASEMQVNNDQTRALRRVGQRLAVRLREVGLERTPDEVADALLIGAGGFTFDAINNGYQYIHGMRPMEELVIDVTYLMPVVPVEVPRESFVSKVIRYLRWIG